MFKNVLLKEIGVHSSYGLGGPGSLCLREADQKWFGARISKDKYSVVVENGSKIAPPHPPEKKTGGDA